MGFSEGALLLQVNTIIGGSEQNFHISDYDTKAYFDFIPGEWFIIFYNV